MTRRLLTTATCAALIALLAAAAATAATPRSFYGVSSQTALKDREYRRMGEGRVGTLRSMLNWRAIDPTKADDDYQWGNFDNTVAAAARGKIEILPFVYGTPNWVARGIDGRHCGNCEQFAPRRGPARAAFASFVGAAVDRYGRGGEFWAEHPRLPREPITAWQIWNEQNSKTFYRPGPTVKGYAKLLDDAAAAIRSRDRRADVVLGGMAELAGSRKATTASSYLAGLYRRKGARKDFDGVAVHPYGAKVGVGQAAGGADQRRQSVGRRFQRRPVGDRDRLGLGAGLRSA